MSQEMCTESPFNQAEEKSEVAHNAGTLTEIDNNSYFSKKLTVRIKLKDNINN